MQQNPLVQLSSLGQSVWIDNLQKSMLDNGTLKKMVEEDNIRGVTSNPTIFQKAIADSHDYDEAIASWAKKKFTPEQIYTELIIQDIQRAADVLRPVYDATHGEDGFVSLEVSPMLAHDSEGTIKEARLLWELTGRPNIFIKVPGTKEGLAPIRKLISEGINVNSTLLFGIPRYREVAEAYMSGLEDRLASGRAITAVTSVASFFLSRIDTLIDPLLEEKMKTKTNESRRVAPLHGAMAIASAKIAYHIFREEFSGKRFKKLVHAGACLQRVLWASTGTKNPGYSDVKYVEALIGPETITTLPPETITAYRDHGKPSSQLSKGVNESKRALKHLAEIGIQLNEQTQKLEEEGVLKFKRSYEDLLAAIKKKSSSA